MAVGMFKLTYRQRKSLLMIFTIFNALQIVLGCCVTGCSLYIIFGVAPMLHVDSAEINFVFVVTGLLGIQVILHWSVGINIGWKCNKLADKKSTRTFLLLWIYAGTITIVNLLLISHFARKISKHIMNSIRLSITTGMKHYLKDPKWKQTIDMLQYNNECCGIYTFEDWHDTKWLTKYQVDVKSDTVKQFRTSEEILTLPVTPWSCCRVKFPMQCLHDPLQQSQFAHIWVDEPTMVINSINTIGCLAGLKKPIMTIITIFILLSALIFLLHVIIFCTIRILYTSSRNAVLLGYPRGIAPGWIFGRGDCGYKGGKSLIDIMEGIKQIEEPESEPETAEPSKKNFFKKLRKKSKDSQTDQVPDSKRESETEPEHTEVENPEETDQGSDEEIALIQDETEVVQKRSPIVVQKRSPPMEEVLQRKSSPMPEVFEKRTSRMPEVVQKISPLILQKRSSPMPGVVQRRSSPMPEVVKKRSPNEEYTNFQPERPITMIREEGVQNDENPDEPILMEEELKRLQQ